MMYDIPLDYRVKAFEPCIVRATKEEFKPCTCPGKPKDRTPAYVNENKSLFALKNKPKEKSSK